MNFLKKIDRFLGNMGHLKASERNHIDTYTEEKINGLRGEKIAKSENGGGIWITLQELAGYKYLNIDIVNDKKMNNYQGCTLSFLNETDLVLNLKSDTKEIESNFSNVSNRWITEVSFDITDIDINLIHPENSTRIKLEYKKTIEFFEIIKPQTIL